MSAGRAADADAIVAKALRGYRYQMEALRQSLDDAVAEAERDGTLRLAGSLDVPQASRGKPRGRSVEGEATEAMRDLARLPFDWHARPEFGPLRRRLAEAPYVIFYDTPLPRRVVIVRILDGRRDLPSPFAASND